MTYLHRSILWSKWNLLKKDGYDRRKEQATAAEKMREAETPRNLLKGDDLGETQALAERNGPALSWTATE